MRHLRPALALAIGSLTLAVILPAWLGGLVSAACRQQLLLPHSLPADLAAIALAVVTTRTDGEKRAARGGRRRFGMCPFGALAGLVFL